MKLKLHLEGNPAYIWTHYGNAYFTGYFFDSSDQLFRENEAIELLLHQFSKNSLESFLKIINGNFAFIITDESSCYLCSDAVNFFPLFYHIKNDELLVSDSFNTIAKQRKDFHINSAAIAEFQNAGFVLLNETLAKEVYKNNANQILKFDLINNSQETIRYSRFISNHFFSKSFEDLELETADILMETGKRLISFLNNRTAVVPLSGGYDSRLIVSVLKKFSYKKVICITYGKPNPEVGISKKVAEILDFEWHFIDYTKLDVASFQEEKNYKDYLEFAANGFSMPYLMEYFAVAEIVKRGYIPENSVFLPGHSGDFLGGSYISKTVKNNLPLHSLAEFIESKYFIFLKKKKNTKKHLARRIKESLESIGESYIDKGYNMTVEEWDIQEKLAKFIFHSSQVFSFFGFEVYFTLWDKNMVRFFRKVPFVFRKDKVLYDSVLEKFFFSPQKIKFNNNELKVSKFRLQFQKVKDSLRYFFPWKIVRERINKADWPYYQKLSEEMQIFVEEKQQKKFKNFKNYNAVICTWYPLFLLEKYGRIGDIKKG